MGKDDGNIDRFDLSRIDKNGGFNSVRLFGIGIGAFRIENKGGMINV